MLDLLYTDAANETSNAIYQTIGYRPLYEAAVYTFKPAPSPARGACAP